ncbi:hypothetical protein [Chryseobacterium sp.]|uniref:hypothetical protein n=1 Tax=Chryseobacterium sp. TaxID=1871047 RepID=UPI0028A25DA5|nr:hypothetical protein [Chryseobacterium sp.]
MEAMNFTREQLAQYILNNAKDSVIDKIKALLEKEEETVAYTIKGQPLTKKEYISHIETISKKIDDGAKTYTSQEVKEYVMNRKARLG